MHSIDDYFFKHDKLIATFKKLTSSLCFLPLFNCRQLSFVTCLKKNTLRICWYTKKHSIESCHACLNITKVGFFFKFHGQEVATFLYLWLSYDSCYVSKNNNTLFTHLWTLHSIYHHLFSTHDKWMAYNLCFLPLFNHNQYCYFSIFFNTLNICSHINDFLIHWGFFSIDN